MTQPPVQFDEDPLLVVRHVMPLASPRHRPALPTPDRQVMGSFHVVEIPNFHGTFGAGNLGQDELEQFAPRMRASRRQGSSK